MTVATPIHTWSFERMAIESVPFKSVRDFGRANSFHYDFLTRKVGTKSSRMSPMEVVANEARMVPILDR